MIELDADHRYWQIQGDSRREVAGVSHILQEMSCKDTHYRGDSQYHKTRGTYVHKAIELDVAGTLDEGTVDPLIVEYLKAWRLFRAERVREIVSCSRRLYQEELDYCGTLDLVAIVRGYERPVLIDGKSGARADWHILQVAAYILAHAGKRWREFEGAALYLRTSGNYVLEVYEPLLLDRKIDEWRALAREFHRKESKLWP